MIREIDLLCDIGGNSLGVKSSGFDIKQAAGKLTVTIKCVDFTIPPPAKSVQTKLTISPVGSSTPITMRNVSSSATFTSPAPMNPMKN